MLEPLTLVPTLAWTRSLFSPLTLALALAVPRQPPPRPRPRPHHNPNPDQVKAYASSSALRTGPAVATGWSTDDRTGGAPAAVAKQALAVPLGDAPPRGRKGAVQGPSPLSQEGNIKEAKWSQSSPNLSSFTSIEEVAMRREIVCDNCERQCPSPVRTQVSHCAPPPHALSGRHRPIAGHFWPAWGALCCPIRHEPEEPARAPSRALHTCRRLNLLLHHVTYRWIRRSASSARASASGARTSRGEICASGDFSPVSGDGQPLQLVTPAGIGIDLAEGAPHSHCMHAHGGWGRGVA